MKSNDDIGQPCELILLHGAYCTIMAISRQNEARSRDYALLFFLMTSKVHYSTQYHMQHCTLPAFEQSGGLYNMHNKDEKYPTRPGLNMSPLKPQSIQMSHWGRPRQPCIMPLYKLISCGNRSLIFVIAIGLLYSVLTQWINLGLILNFLRLYHIYSHSILLKAFSKSNKSNMPVCLFDGKSEIPS